MCEKPQSLARREKFWKETYHTEEKGHMHNVLYQYCAGCCSQYIDAWEKILFYDC